jgi:hypothetical protein
MSGLLSSHTFAEEETEDSPARILDLMPFIDLLGTPANQADQPCQQWSWNVFDEKWRDVGRAGEQLLANGALSLLELRFDPDGSKIGDSVRRALDSVARINRDWSIPNVEPFKACNHSELRARWECLQLARSMFRANEDWRTILSTGARSIPSSRSLRMLVGAVVFQARQQGIEVRPEEAHKWADNYWLERDRPFRALGEPLPGIAYEKLVAAIFSLHGLPVEFTPATGDFGADLIVGDAPSAVVIQVKHTKTPVGVEAVQQAVSAKAHYGAQSAMVVSRHGFTKAAKQLAASTGCALHEHIELMGWATDAHLPTNLEAMKNARIR